MEITNLKEILALSTASTAAKGEGDKAVWSWREATETGL
jgi:hypothetical protein